MVLMCKRLLPESKRTVYLQGAASFKLPKGRVAVKVYCSPHNPGARELAEEMNTIWPRLLQVVDVQSWSDLSTCDHMLVYLNALTWTHDPETFAADIREAMPDAHGAAPAAMPRVSECNGFRQRAGGARVQTDHGRDADRSQEVADQHLQANCSRAQGGRAARAGARNLGGEAGGVCVYLGSRLLPIRREFEGQTVLGAGMSTLGPFGQGKLPPVHQYYYAGPGR
eukprot:3556705-Prymnesium_polylepis.1